MTAFDKLTNSQKMRAALYRDVRAMSSETCHFLGLEITKPAMEIITELVYKKITVYGTDLEAFCKHAKRTTITSEDVKLLARRNPSLLSHLNALAPTNPAPQKRRKTVTKLQETPAKTTEDSASKAKTTEDSVSKVKATVDSRSTEKIAEVEKDKEDDLEAFVDDLVLNDTIDLTFD